MMQVFVHFQNTLVFQFDEAPHGSDIRSVLSSTEKIPEDYFYLQVDGKHFGDNDVLPLCSLVVRASLRVNGGKGGFGAMLKSMAKQAGSKKTTDFGACRDLSGRRLRHVNDELILKKWQEAKDRGDEFDTAQDTETGIDLWFLSAPSWADGFKSHHRKKYMKNRTKTRMCLDWLNARADGKDAPKGSPAWWGCPRGPRCEFAHGEDELRGDGKKKHEERKKAERMEAERKKKDTYMGAVESNQSSEEMSNMVAEGLARGKKSRRLKSDNVSDKVDGKDEGIIGDREVHQHNDHLTRPNVPDFSLENIVTKKENMTSQDNTLEPPVWLEAMLSQTSSVVLHSGGVVQCTKGFGSVKVAGDMDWRKSNKCSESNMEDLSNNIRWYYEVELITCGLLQIGWADSDFVVLPPVTSDNEDVGDDTGGAGENGVGDDKHSWSYDGFRQLCWNETSQNYPNTSKGKRKGSHDGSGIWKAGDVIGCFLDIDTERKVAAMSFYLNGCDLGVAFNEACSSLKCSVENMFNGKCKIFPALSLEENQSAAINIGQRPFQYANFPGVSSCFSLLDLSSHQMPKLDNDSINSATEDANVFFHPIDLESDDCMISSSRDLEAVGMSHLKAELQRRGLKAGGTLEERAARLFSVKGLRTDEIPRKLLAKKPKS